MLNRHRDDSFLGRDRRDLQHLVVQVFRHIPTSLDLNGPVLSFTTQPTTTFGDAGSNATLTGIATVSFPGNPSPDNTGTITYQWYGPGGALTNGTKYSGATTSTLTINNLQTPGDSGENYYVEAAYTHSTETGNAVNEPLTQGNQTTEGAEEAFLQYLQEVKL